MNESSSVPPLPSISVNAAESARRRLTNKLIMIAAVITILQVPLWLIDSTRDERAKRHAESVAAITTSWGGDQRLMGPVLVVPYIWTQENGQVLRAEGEMRLLPETLAVTGDLATRELSRGIYRAQVYAAALHVEGRFTVPPKWRRDARWQMQWEQARLVYAVSDARGLRAEQSLRWNGAPAELQGGTGMTNWPAGMQAPVTIDPVMGAAFEITLNLDGSGALEFVPLASSTDVALSSTWPSPGFRGAYLPSERTVEPTGFAAKWKIGALGNDLPRDWMGGGDAAVAERMSAATFGVGLVPEVGEYRTIERAIKYGILFLVTVFAGFFLGEVVGGRSLHVLNYLLVGAALCLFYLALLALSEFWRFGWAYIAAAGASTLLVGLYATAVMGARKPAGVLGLLMAGIYGYLYFVLQLEDVALVGGTVLLFGLLGAVMYATRHLRFDDATALGGPMGGTKA
ncbi:cell envelope integrity protein CreD [Synoicihabitans lomoniglobus]|uniref:Cell envelope integrity protein CreD n=1 Tax=Synoicihabitans lomoniglobus TaxID=2909285 RepID=A0AAE9ZRL9_9BACT|nr:cell envelope integrity protein CreD [Opitutaceae bacterium LMO-M01]WED63975.1 cell envelope integrity protein CreD [Opitutaceae bacterium LMO-M01]